jgi:D-glycero-D-manno-heptose 1,7-bisphosphate phosphatase
MGIDAVTPRAVFLDRDGVINAVVLKDGRPYPPAAVDDVRVLPGVPGALAALKQAGYALIVVTNQPDVARGRQTRATVEAIHARLAETLPIDEFRVCYHDDADRCSCRKPAPGLILQAPVYDVSRSFLVGDRWRDIDAGQRAGCRACILVDAGYAERQADAPDARVASLAEAAAWIIGAT